MTNETIEEFTQWLEKEIENNKLLIKKTEKLKISPVVIEKLQQEVDACIIVHRKLFFVKSTQLE